MENRISQTVKKFLQWSEIVKSNAQSTVTNYGYALTEFLAFVDDDIDVEKINVSHMYDYQIFLNRKKTSKGKPLKQKTKRERLVAIRSFLRYCHRHDITTLAPDRVELPKLPDTVVNFLTNGEVQKMLNESMGKDIVDMRNYALLQMLYSTGMRVQEIVNIDRCNVDTHEREFQIIGKGGKRRIVFLSSSASLAIREYLDARDDDFDALFINHATNNQVRGDGRLQPSSIRKILKAIAKNAGIHKKVSPHIFRHSFATDLMSNGADIRSIQELLGHASIRTTEIYTHVTNPQLRQIHAKFHNVNS